MEGEGGGGHSEAESGKARLNMDWDCMVDFSEILVEEMFCWLILIIFVSVRLSSLLRQVE